MLQFFGKDLSEARASPIRAAPALLPSASGADTANAGKAVFSAYCVSCHGPAGDASIPAGRKPKVADLRSDEVQNKSNEELFNTIAHGI